MDSQVNFSAMIWHRTFRIIFSLRGLIAILFSFYFIGAIAWMLPTITEQGGVIAEIWKTFSSDLAFSWLLFDGALSKLVSIFIAPLFVFDAISGDKTGERMPIIMSRPITRTQYVLMKLSSGMLAFTLLFLPIMGIGYFVFSGLVEGGLDVANYFATCILFVALAFFCMAVCLLISALVKKNLVSFLAAFGLMSIAMTANASKNTSDALLASAQLTPHYYATYFASPFPEPHDLEIMPFLGCLVVIILFALPFLYLTILKFKKEDL
ncbi:MAG: ABC transporter permease subunit [Thermoplasmata archaeon]|nr:ABC transporter permease subunit [Thermoplasmata archaeon]